MRRPKSPRDGRGIVYLIGAGPGDPRLLTVRGDALLRSAEVIVYDHLASTRLLDLAPQNCLNICAGKSIGHNEMPQEVINRTLVEHATAGKRVVRLKGGDPNIFGRGAEEAEFLSAHGIAFEVVPGITAAAGVSAYAGIPLTHREVASAVAFVTGHDDPESPTCRLDWAAIARFPGTLAVYMGVTHLGGLCRTLIRLGKPPETPAILVESATLPRQRSVSATLADLPQKVAEAGLGPPALCIIGEVVSRRQALTWFERKPLFGQRIVVTRPLDAIEGSAAILEEQGAEVLSAPMITIGPVVNPSALDSAIDRIASFDWLVFTSAHGVTYFLGRLEALGHDLRVLSAVKIAAIGPTTADALAKYRLRADLVPTESSSESLAAALCEAAAGKRLLLAQADRGRPTLKAELEKSAFVEQVAAYRNADATALSALVLDRIREGTVDWITITSPAVVLRLHALLPDSARNKIGGSVKLASLSPLTSSVAEHLGWQVAVEARVATWESLVEAICERVKLDRHQE